jgi:hypothetical protein
MPLRAGRACDFSQCIEVGHGAVAERMGISVLRKIGTPAQLSIIANAVEAYCERYDIKDPHHREQLALRVRQHLQLDAIQGLNPEGSVAGNVIAYAMNEGIPIDQI